MPESGKAVPKGKVERFQEAVAELRLEPFHKSALAMLTPEVVRFAAVWPRVMRWIEEPANEEDRLPLAWQMTRFDFREWAALAGTDIWTAARFFQFLSIHNLIFPDGALRLELSKLADAPNN